MTLTRSQRRNLDKLATYLEGLPEDYQHFDMLSWLRSCGDDAAVIAYVRKNGGVDKCGTAACAVGHGPAAGVLFRTDDLFCGDPDWPAYCRRFVPSRRSSEFYWAFGSAWKYYDNHHWGAAARVRFLLKHGKPPKWFGEDAGGEWLDAYREFDKRHAPVSA